MSCLHVFASRSVSWLMRHGFSIVKLVQNRRSHGSIIAFSNRYYYEDELRAGAHREVTTSLFGSPILVKEDFPIVFHGVFGQDQRSGRSQSYFNVSEASLVKNYCLQLVNDPQRHVGKMLSFCG